jgi:hypothetical protein|nr:MAG TPA: hypothetical protein [Caudoviricetes sp.]
MTKRELIEILENVDDDAIILFGNNNYSNNIATNVYVKERTETEESEILITNNFVTRENPIFFEKITD